MTHTSNNKGEENFRFLLEQFSDIKIMQFRVDGFEDLSLSQKKLLYYLSQAALCGRDIIYDQFYKHNLSIRRTNEAIWNSYSGDRNTNNYKAFEVYAKCVWFSNGIHHHYSTDKFFPELDASQFKQFVLNSKESELPLLENENLADFAERITSIVYDNQYDTKRIVLDQGKDLVQSSATNFYHGVSQKEVEKYQASLTSVDDKRPLSFGLNSKLVKEGNDIKEQVYKLNGLYGQAIEHIVINLEKATRVAESMKQQEVINLLIAYYKTGDLQLWDYYNVAWLSDLSSKVDFVNGFIENYGDPLGIKATWESVVNFINMDATKRTEIISANAQWFEDNAPIDNKFRKKEVKGVSAKVITVVQLGGDCYPATPIGINLPNADWIRKEHGSKSVTMDNITYAYHKAAEGNGFMEEFCYTEQEIAWDKKYGSLASNLHTDLHECLGHGSGQLLPDTSPDALKSYASVLEEARADLFALYYIADPKLLELGLIPSLDVAFTEYNAYLRNGYLTQLTRIKPGNNIEQAHMRNRQLIARWCFDHASSDIIELIVRDNKSYVVIHNYQKLRNLFAQLLAEVQRIKSTGDYEAGKNLVEKYAIKVDEKLHKEILDRYKKLNIAPYGGFTNPNLVPVFKGDEIVDVKINYGEDYAQQMLRYGKEYSFLPNYS